MKALLVCGGVIAMLVCVTVVAQERTPTPPDGSLAALTAEVRLLRAAVEKGTQIQTQIQGLGVYLSAEQNRLIQVSGRVDTLRGQLDAAVRVSQDEGERVARARTGLAGTPTPAERADLQQLLDHAQTQLQRATAKENELRAREAEASVELQTELARWTDLLARLEQTIRQ